MLEEVIVWLLSMIVVGLYAYYFLIDPIIRFFRDE